MMELSAVTKAKPRRMRGDERKRSDAEAMRSDPNAVMRPLPTLLRFDTIDLLVCSESAISIKRSRELRIYESFITVKNWQCFFETQNC